MPTNQTVGRTWRDTDFYCRQRTSREGVKGAERQVQAGAGVGRGRCLPPSPLNDVCRLSNARVNWNTCDCLKCCNPRLVHRFLLPFPPPHTRLHFPLPYILIPPPSLLVCWHANFNVCKSYASRGALAVAVATPTSLAPPHLHTRAVHTYVKRTPLPTPPLSRQLNPFCAH